MHLLDEKFIKSLIFTAEQLTILRTIGEYQGKQELYFKQSPEILRGFIVSQGKGLDAKWIRKLT